MARILIAEDDHLIASFIDKALRASLHTTLVVTDGQEATRVATAEDFDLMVLDLGLPVMSGIDVLRELRRRNDPLPVLVLTGQQERWGPAECLDHGADDYVTKPFSVDELLARVRARLRAVGSEERSTFTHGSVVLDRRSMRVTKDGRLVSLTTREFALLETFLRHPEQVLSREQLLEHVWGYDASQSSTVVNSFVVTLRRKLGGDLIETVRGSGYRLSPEARDSR
jgi:DNA-binding response OmpR family regulator